MIRARDNHKNAKEPHPFVLAALTMPLISANMVCAIWLRLPIASIADSRFISFYNVFSLLPLP